MRLVAVFVLSLLTLTPVGAQRAAMRLPGEMGALIEAYARVSPRLYQIANYFKDAKLDAAPFAFDLQKVAIKAPIRTQRIRCSSPSRRGRASSIRTRRMRSRPDATSTGKGSWHRGGTGEGIGTLRTPMKAAPATP